MNFSYFMNSLNFSNSIIFRTDSDSEVYDLKSQMSVLKTNLKIKEKENKRIEQLNSKLKAKVIQLKKKMLNFGSFHKEIRQNKDEAVRLLN